MRGGSGLAAPGGKVWLSIFCPVFGLMVATTKEYHAQRPQADYWVGKRLVQRVDHLSLRTERPPAVRSVTEIDIYDVKRTNGPSLWPRTPRRTRTDARRSRLSATK